MNRTARRLIHLLLGAAGVLALSGCARDADGDFWHMSREHLEFHVLGGTETFQELHRVIDRHLFDHNVRDPDAY
jgi:hypothetical protein